MASDKFTPDDQSSAPEKSKSSSSSTPKQASAESLSKGAMTKPRHKRVWIPVVIVVSVGAVLLLGFVVFQSDDNGSQTGVNAPAGSSRKIDGVSVASEKANLKPVAIMVENLVESRPQSGLDKAQLVVEALVEGGITRFMAVYASDDPVPEIGPVRSARPYYLDWAKGLNAMYMHVGGSPTALSRIDAIGVESLNQFFNSQYYWRASDRPAPHNLYTSSELVTFALRDKYDGTRGAYDSWSYVQGAPVTSPTESIQIDFSSFSYLVEWDYDSFKNEYSRQQAGKPHVMKNGNVITSSNVIVQYVKTTLEDASRLAMETTGTGRAQIFTNGEMIEGTWKKDSVNDRTVFYDERGNEVDLNPGTTWIEVLPTDRTVTVI